jgi:hypothetical protein
VQVRTRAEPLFIQEYHFASKSFVAVCEIFSNAYPDKKGLDKTYNNVFGHRKCLSVTVAHRATKQLKLRPYRFEAVQQLQQGDTAAEFKTAINFFLCVKGSMCIA